jgi:hypothetical protein
MAEGFFRLFSPASEYVWCVADSFAMACPGKGRFPSQRIQWRFFCGDISVPQNLQRFFLRPISDATTWDLSHFGQTHFVLFTELKMDAIK